MNRKKTIFVGIIIFFMIIILDQVTKVFFINKNIIIMQGGLLEFNYTENTGIAFNIGIGNIFIIGIINILVLGLIVVFIAKSKINLKVLIPLFLIFSGGISNLIDRILRGYVIDFIDIYNFPNFNLADVSITIGIVLLIYRILKDSILEHKEN